MVGPYRMIKLVNRRIDINARPGPGDARLGQGRLVRIVR